LGRRSVIFGLAMVREEEAVREEKRERERERE